MTLKEIISVNVFGDRRLLSELQESKPYKGSIIGVNPIFSPTNNEVGYGNALTIVPLIFIEVVVPEGIISYTMALLSPK